MELWVNDDDALCHTNVAYVQHLRIQSTGRRAMSQYLCHHKYTFVVLSIQQLWLGSYSESCFIDIHRGTYGREQ